MSDGQFRIDRTGLPYNTFVPDPSWLGSVEEEKPDVKCVLIHDHFQNAKAYNIPRAQLMICDIPYNIGTDFYASRPDWYVDGDNKNGESEKAHKAAFNTDFHFNIPDFFAFGNRLLKKEPTRGEKDAPCMIVFCAFQQIPEVIRQAEKYGFKNYIPLVFCTPAPAISASSWTLARSIWKSVIGSWWSTARPRETGGSPLSRRTRTSPERCSRTARP